MGNLSIAPVHIHNIPPFLATAIVKTWQVGGLTGDFEPRLDSQIIDYIKAQWLLTDPLIGGAGPIAQQQNINIGNFEYDNFRTYYIRVIERPARVVNRVRPNLYYFDAPIDFEIYSRRLSKGEAYDELTQICNELVWIWFLYQGEQIPGVLDCDIESLAPAQPKAPKIRLRDSAAKTIWQRNLRISLYYYKVNLLRPVT